MSSTTTTLSTFCDSCDRMIIDGLGRLHGELWTSTEGETLCGTCAND